MRISIAIMAHPSRLELAQALERRLGAELVLERGEGEWDTGRRALLSYDPAAAYHVVIQDDAILASRFEQALPLVLEHAQELPVGLYVGRVMPRSRLVTRAVGAAHRSGSPWLEMGGPWWGVAVAFPPPTIPALVAWCDLSTHPFYDARISRWTRTSNLRCRYPIPSLVDHDPRRPSLIHTSTLDRDRRAHDPLGDRDPAEIDWSRPPVVVDYRDRVLVPAEL